MNDQATEPQTQKLVFEYDLDAEPEKVWRAIHSEEYREKWLAKNARAASEVVSAKPGQEVTYRMRDDEPPFLESVVTFRISPNQAGGTNLRIIHELADRRFDRRSKAANSNGPPLLLAA